MLHRAPTIDLNSTLTARQPDSAIANGVLGARPARTRPIRFGRSIGCSPLEVATVAAGQEGQLAQGIR